MSNPYEKEANIAIKEVEKLTTEYTDKKVKSQADVVDATNYLGQVQTTLKNITKKQKSIIDPLNQSIKEIKDLFAKPLSTLKNEEIDVKNAILAYQIAEQKKLEKKQEKIEAKAEAGELSTAEAMQKLEKMPENKTSYNTGEFKASVRTIKKVKVVDVSKLPLRYLLNVQVQEAINRAVKEDALAEAAGQLGLVLNDSVEVYEEKTLAGGLA